MPGPELNPEPGDDVIYKTRFSGFYETDLDARLKKMGVKHLMVTGCTTSICADSTVRNAMFRDYVIAAEGLLANDRKSEFLFKRRLNW